MGAPPKSHNRRLRVEGSDDLHSIIALLTRHGADFARPDPRLPHVSIEPEGVDAALASIDAGVKTYERFGIVIDAELPGPETPDRWAQARDRLRKVGLGVPDLLPREGLVVEGLRPGHRVGLDRALAEGAPLSPKDRLKGVLHAWLAWQEQPGMPFGTGITTRAFQADSPEALTFVGWFRRLFDAP